MDFTKLINKHLESKIGIYGIRSQVKIPFNRMKSILK